MAKALLSALATALMLAAARKVFLSNHGDECGQFPVGTEGAYDEFYAAMKLWGQFELMRSPAQADRIFGFRLSCPTEVVVGNLRSDPAWPLPRLTLVIRDARSRAVLWTAVLYLNMASLNANRGKDLECAIADTIDDLRKLVARAGNP